MSGPLWDFLTSFISLYPLYMSFVWLVGGLLFFFRWERSPRRRLSAHPFFSLVIAAHNEEKTIEGVVRKLGALNYPDYEVIVVNDGSTDGTRAALDALSEECGRRLKVVHLRPNSGKAQALNTGILCSRGDCIMVIDADCYLDRNALRMMAWHFVNFPRVGAVTGNPRIINRTSLLGKIQVGEYSSIIGLIKRMQRILGKVLTVSGVIAAYRRSALFDAGLFDPDTATEDIDITWKLQKKRWEVRYEPRALCYILSPETIAGLWRQRVRWAQGGAEVVRKHFDVWFDWRSRRFWPVYLEYVSGIAWSFCICALLLSWTAHYLLILVTDPASSLLRPMLPSWSGSLLGLACLVQFLASFYIDHRYEERPMRKYYFWIIWYPLFYWFLGALASCAGVYAMLTKKGGSSSIWKSPDRGLHTLKS